MKTGIYIALIIIFAICLVYFSGDKNNLVLAAGGANTSDVQLMARAINRGSKRRVI